jgi:hypothetical protein
LLVFLAACGGGSGPVLEAGTSRPSRVGGVPALASEPQTPSVSTSYAAGSARAGLAGPDRRSGVEGVLERTDWDFPEDNESPPALPATGVLKVRRADSQGVAVGDPVASVSVGESGQFRIPLSPGRYRIDAVLTGKEWFGRPVGFPFRTFEVVRGQFVHVDLTVWRY